MTDFAGKPALAPPLAGRDIAPAGASVAGVAAVAGRNVRLQHLRGFAAVLVLVFHAAEYLRQLRGDAGFLSVFDPFLGAYGVAVFFVLSGYLMARLGRDGDGHRFLIDRVLRIYPLMLIVFAIAALAYWITGFARRPDLIALTLVPAGPRNYFLGIEWTLLLEMTYYVIIAGAMMTGLRRWLAPAFALWLAGLALLWLSGLAPKESNTPTLSTLFLQPANAAFLMGFLLPGILAWRRLPGAVLLCLAALAIALLAVVAPGGTPDRWIAGASALLLVAAALRAAPAAAGGLWNTAWLRLGDASYALYLCHVPLIIISGNILPRDIPHWLLWLGWCGAALGCALLLGRLDIGLHERLKAWARNQTSRQIATMSLSFLAAFAAIAFVADIRTRVDRYGEAKALAALAKTKPTPWPSALVGIDSSAILADGKLVLRGYGVDLASPDDDSHVAIEQAGRLIGFDRMTRMRVKTAEEAHRPDLASIRFGFGVVSDGPLRCEDGALSAKIILSSGKVVPIASDVLDAVCAGRDGRKP